MAFDFEYKRSLDHTQPMVEKVHIGASQTIKAGMLLDVSSGLGVKAAATATAILGIALADITTGLSVGDDDQIPVLMLNTKSVIRAKYTGSSKTSLTAADKFGTAYDLAVDGTTGAQTVNLDDTTGGLFLVVGYNNDNNTVDVVIKADDLWNA